MIVKWVVVLIAKQEGIVVLSDGIENIKKKKGKKKRHSVECLFGFCFFLCFAVATKNVDEFVANDLFDCFSCGSQILSGVEV